MARSRLQEYQITQERIAAFRAHAAELTAAGDRRGLAAVDALLGQLEREIAEVEAVETPAPQPASA